MKTIHALLFAGGVSLAAMSFRPAPEVAPDLLNNREKTSGFNTSLSTIVSSNRTPLFTPAVAFALAESSYLGTAAATAAAANWLFGFTTRSSLLGTYKNVMKEVDMRNLDAPRM
ncbi:hypothetical protein [uncultured Chitinophaga sp.]|jgi:hypothetical protein|uniref:hypothetical protein n=1 Tax=uncultured Chitinophaga sp. TaxID=339340 RepID=UPI0026147A22|nr:hypothetical protein [uncultured Chitinophaga sp.]